MKEKWTKLGKSLICLALVTSMLAGCGGGGNSSSSSKEQTSGGTSGEVATGDDNFNETGLPIVKEPVELTFLYVKGANTMDFKDNAMFQQMEKDTNVKINWQYAGDADWGEQKSLLLASGDLPDVFFGDNALKDNDIATNLDMFIPLEDYVEKYCPNIKAAWEAEPTMRQMVTNPDGHIYTFDTAEIYGDGRSERVVGEAARRIGRDKVRIISKVFKPSMSHDKMIKACEDSLQRLGTDYLDVYFLHYPVAEEEVTIQERMETMEELKKAGKIRAIGLSNFSLEEMKAAMRFGQVDVIQPCYSLLWRYDEALLEFSRKQGISVIPYSTLAQGLLTGKYQKGAVFTDGRARAALFQPENYDRCLEVTDVLSQISAKYGKTPAQGAIAWLLQTPGITAPIVGAKNGRQAQENLKAAGWQFSKEDYDVIDRASRRFMEGLPHYTLFFNTETTN